MKKELIKKELTEQNEFLRSMLRSFDDIKNGRIRRFEFSQRKKRKA